MNLLALLSYGSTSITHYFNQLLTMTIGIILYWMLMPYRTYASIFSFFFSAAMSKTQKEVLLATEKKKRDTIIADNKNKDRQIRELELALRHSRHEEKVLQERLRSSERKHNKFLRQRDEDVVDAANKILQQSTNWIINFNYVAVAITIYAVYSLLAVAPSGVERKLVFVLSIPIFHSVAGSMLSRKSDTKLSSIINRTLCVLIGCSFLCGFVLCFFLRRRAEM